jgi:hypothetical protein
MPLLNGDSVTLDAVSSYPHEVGQFGIARSCPS